MRRVFLAGAIFFTAAACSGTQQSRQNSDDDAGRAADTGTVGPSTDARVNEDAALGVEPDGGTEPEDLGPGADARPHPDAGVAMPQIFTLTFGPVPIGPGQEVTQCVVKRLGNTDPVHIASIHNVLGATSHHLIIYRTNDTMEQPTPFRCAPFVETLNPARGAPLMITQRHDETLTLPEGVAYTLDADQMLRIEMHYINATTRDMTAMATSTFTTLPDEEFREEANFLFIGSPDIRLPPMTMTTLGPVYFQVPSEFNGVKFFAITGHEHQLGTKVTVATTPSRTGPDTMVYDVPNWLWNEPATVYQEPPFIVPQGGGFRFTCRWNNTTTHQVNFGESANNEMCFFWAYYYPSHGAKVCFHTDQVPGGADVCCPGSAVCSLLFR